MGCGAPTRAVECGMNKLVLCALVVIAGCATPRAGRMAATVQSVTGSAEVQRKDGQWRPLRQGDRLGAGASVQTGPGGTISFQLGTAGGVLVLHPNSTVVFEQLGAAPDPDVLAVLNLTRGRVTGDTLRPPGQRKIIVKTPGGMHEVR
jgi:hypothetical protein